MKQARGRVYKRQGVWWYRVFLGNGKLFVYDNCKDFQMMLDDANRDVRVARRMEAIGHDTKSDYMLLVMEEEI